MVMVDSLVLFHNGQIGRLVLFHTRQILTLDRKGNHVLLLQHFTNSVLVQ